MWSKQEAKETLLNILPNVDILLAGDDEMEIILGTKVPEQIFHQLREFNMSFIAIKRGEKGSVGFSESKTMELPAIKNTSVVDTVGAGDGFNAGVLYGYLQKWSLKKILTFANMIGSIVVG